MRSLRGVALVALALGCGLGGAVVAVGAAQPRQEVVVASRNLRAGQRLSARDLRLATIPVGGRAAGELEPAALIHLLVGQYLSSAVIAGAPVLVDEMHPARTHITNSGAQESFLCRPQG
jgi:Flp pilus assembly protein CpaB